MSKTLYITIGISGSGKSSYVNKIFNREDIVCPDLVRKELTGSISDQSENNKVWILVKERILDRLNTNKPVVLDATNTYSKLRGQFLQDIPNDVEKIALVFPVPELDIAYDRVKKDIDSGIDRSNVPKDVIERQIQQMNNGLENIKTQFDTIFYVNDDLKGYTTKGSDI